jgi:hypothetical protein
VEYRELLTTNTPWTSLASNYPAKAGTNWTTFTHSNIVVYPPSDTNGGGGGGSFGGPPGFNFATAANAQMETLSAEDLLPYPWNPRYQPIQTSALMSAQTLNAEGGGGPENLAPYTPKSMGFYRVVRTGVSPWDWPSNVVVSGQTIVYFELGTKAAAELGFYAAITNNGALIPVPGFDFGNLSNGFVRATWNTALTTNGTYRLVFGATLEGDSSSAIEGRAYTVAVSNLIWFPDSYNWGGYFISVQAQSVHTNGTYHVDIYNQSGTKIVALNGTNDAQGFIIYNGSRGFRVINYNSNNVQYPDLFFKVVVQTTAAGQNLVPATAINTNFIWMETAWPSNTANNLDTQFAIAYMPIYGNPSGGSLDALTLQTMIQAVYSAAENRNNFPVKRGQSQAPNELYSNADFARLLADLNAEEVRNLYYFGHGNPDWIGVKNLKNGVLTFLEIDDFYTFFNNKPNNPAGRRHPFRFTFLDGCTTAAGDLCKAFGCPKIPNMSTNDFLKKGLRYRAFMGWDNKQVIKWASALNTQHTQFVGDFYDHWFNPNPNTGNDSTIRESITAATKGWAAVPHLIV